MTLSQLRLLSITLISALLLAMLARYFLSGEESAPLEAPVYVVERTGVRAAGCALAAIRAAEPDAIPLDPASGLIPASRAESAADALLRQHTGLEAYRVPAFTAGPAPIRAILPDGEVYSAYYRLWIPEPDGALGYSENAVVVYIDAHTGQPLALFDGVTVVDPLSAADCLRPPPPGLLEVARASFHRMQIGLLAGLVLALLGIAWVTVKLRMHGPHTGDS